MANLNKKELRKKIAEQKKQQSEESLILRSDSALSILETLPRFKDAKTILLYHSLKDEVRTDKFIERWKDKKNILLPVVDGEILRLKKYNQSVELSVGAFGIEEPSGLDFTNYEEIDLAIVPGVSFDCNKNRLGRGKGYYDRLLPQISAYKIGLCYEFQISEQIPTEPHDLPMDAVLTEQGIR